jgi:hypothetical protein
VGFGRVYVHLPNGFDYDQWLQGLAAGRSFVTTGPMLLCERAANEIRGTVLSVQAAVEVELIVNGRIVETFSLDGVRNAAGGYQAEFQRQVEASGTNWAAVRVWEKAQHVPGTDRWRFAHSAPLWRDVEGQPLRPRQEEAEFLAKRVRDELARSQELLPPDALREYQSALSVYETAGRTSTRE